MPIPMRRTEKWHGKSGRPRGENIVEHIHSGFDGEHNAMKLW